MSSHQLTTSPPQQLRAVPVILGPTASGKTRIAVRLATEFGGEIISADSRQVYRGMDIGTGKDLEEYATDGLIIPCHLIDIADPGYEYNVYEFQQDFLRAYHDITSRGKLPVLCGGSGMYLESVIRGYRLPELPEDPAMLAELESRSDEDLLALYHSICKPHNTTDTVERHRVIKAIRIAVQQSRETIHTYEPTGLRFTVFGILTERTTLRKRITERLHERLDQGMVAEVQRLLDSGITPARLKRYGLEYKYVAMYLSGELHFGEMTSLLNTAIHQFAKRQMTWFRRMERSGIHIIWIPWELDIYEKIQLIAAELKKML
jgi:tRNA dimethylallyltransferase